MRHFYDWLRAVTDALLWRTRDSHQANAVSEQEAEVAQKMTREEVGPISIFFHA